MATTLASEPSLIFEGVTVQFGGLLALDNVSFSVGQNEIVGLIGPNGAGKTTAFNVACGFVRPTKGSVQFPAAGHRSLRPSQLARAGIARTLQGVGLFPRLSILENVMAGAHSRHGSSFFPSILGLPVTIRRDALAREEAMGILERLGVDSYATALPTAVPYGVAKKASVARALMTHPHLLLLDEPASGLDESELHQFAELIGGLKESMSVLLVEHNMDFVMPLVERLVVLDFGEVIATGSPDDVAKNPDVLAAYLGVDE